MKPEDTVMKAGDLCIMVCRNHRSSTLEAKDCTGLDCEECQLKAQAEISFKAGLKEVVEWGEETCDHPIGMRGQLKRRECEVCRQAKLKEWGIK